MYTYTYMHIFIMYSEMCMIWAYIYTGQKHGPAIWKCKQCILTAWARRCWLLLRGFTVNY